MKKRAAKSKFVTRVMALVMSTLLLFGTTACGTGETVGGVKKESDGTYTVTIMEPMHGLGYLALYIANNEGYFLEEGLNVDIIVSTSQVVSTLNGECFAHITSSDRNEATAAGSGLSVVTFANLATRANVQIAASTAVENYTGDTTVSADNLDFIEYLLTCNPDGVTTIATAQYGSSPNTCVRYLLSTLGFEMNPGDTTVYTYDANGLSGEVHLCEQADETARATAVTTGQAQLNCTAEPILANGVDEGWWYEHFFNFGNLGEFAYSNLGTTDANLETKLGKEITQKLANGLAKAYAIMNGASEEYLAGNPGENYDKLLQLVKDEFGASYSDEVIETMVNHYIEWGMWSLDGTTSEECIDMDMKAMKVVGIYTEDYDYSKMVDNSFMIEAVTKLK